MDFVRLFCIASGRPPVLSTAFTQKQIPSSYPQGHGLGKTSKKRDAEYQFHKSKGIYLLTKRHGSLSSIEAFSNVQCWRSASRNQ
jgi:hypothetical protein